MNHNEEVFSLYRDDPFWRLLRKLHLGCPDGPILRRAMPFLVAVTWGGIAVIHSLQDGWTSELTAGNFFADFAAYAQFWVGIPLFLAAEVHLDWRARAGSEYLERSGLLDARGAEDLRRMREQLGRWRTGWVEYMPLALGVLLTVVWLLDELRRSPAAWYLTDIGGSTKLSAAGWYSAIVCFPLLNGYWVRWIWKTFMWCRYLWHTSRLELRLMPHHPDRMGGIGILSWVQMAFALVVFAIGCIMAATVAYKLSVQSIAEDAVGVWLPILGFALLAPALFVMPLMFFTRALLKAKQAGLVALGVEGMRHAAGVGAVSARQAPKCDSTADAELSLAGVQDMDVLYRSVADMRIVPFDLRSLGQFVMSAIAPLMPLILKYARIPEQLADVLKGLR